MNFPKLKMAYLVMLFYRKIQFFQKLAKSTQNVNVARFACNLGCDLQTLQVEHITIFDKYLFHDKVFTTFGWFEINFSSATRHNLRPLHSRLFLDNLSNFWWKYWIFNIHENKLEKNRKIGIFFREIDLFSISIKVYIMHIKFREFFFVNHRWSKKDTKSIYDSQKIP